MTDTTPNLTLPYIIAAQAQKHATHNEAIRALDAIVQLSVENRGLATPPTTPADGARYVVGDSATAAWTGHDKKVAAFQDGAWMFYAPRAGWLAWVVDEDTLVAWDGSDWVTAGGGGSVNPAPLVGVNATADATNRLAVSSPATLLNHAGNDHQLKINKNAAGDTGSVLFQTGFSGRAEFGLTGDDDFHVKVSPDGSAWNEAIVIDRNDGSVSFPNSSLGGGSSVAADDEGTEVLANAVRFNFAGSGVAVSDGGSGEAVVTIPGTGGSGNVPSGGSAGQQLAKASAADHDTEWVSQPTTPLATDVTRIDGDQLAAIVDANNKVLLAFAQNGEASFPGIAATAGAFGSISVADTTTEQVWGIAYAVVHSNNKVAFYVLEDGSVGMPGLSARRYAIDGVAAGDRPAHNAVDYNVHLNSGQSLAAAGNTGPVSFAATDFDYHAGAGSLTALDNAGSYGVGLVATEQIKFALKGDAGRNLLSSPGFSDDNFVQVYSSNAVSGVEIEALQPGASPDRFADHIAALAGVVTAATAANKVVQVPYLTWIHGESDSADTNYKADLISLKDSYNTSALAATGQPDRFPLIYTQVAGSNNSGMPLVGKAQWEAWQDDSELVLVGPNYPYRYTDALHLVDASYQWLGQQVGKVAYLTGYMGKVWKPLYPLSVDLRPGNVLIVKLHVPAPPIVLDTSTIAAATNYGFRCFDSSGEITISSVAIVNADTIRIKLASTPGSAPMLEYAWRDDPTDGGSGNFDSNGLHAIRGNIRDSDASAAVYGSAYPLWNWLVRFEKSITV